MISLVSLVFVMVFHAKALYFVGFVGFCNGFAFTGMDFFTFVGFCKALSIGNVFMSTV